MGFTCGIVGLPNVGKSTLFNALTKSSVLSANYPFSTIEPNVGVVPVPDPRLIELTKIAKPQKTVPTTMHFVDIAGIVAGASKGEGLGNRFLAAIREVDAIAQVVRCFEDGNIVHVQGKVSPIDDIETIHTELALADLESIQKALIRIGRGCKAGDKQALFEKSAYEKVEQVLNQGLPARSVDLSGEEKACVQRLCLLTLKPMLYIANVLESGFSSNPHLDAVIAYAEREQSTVVTICAALEAELSSLDDLEQQDFLSSLGLQEPGLHQVIRAGYALLGLHTYFTVGEKEVRAWTIPMGATAPEAAGVIHSDFQRGFIRAEVVAYEDFLAGPGEERAKKAGKMRLEGKSYLVKDGDIIHFLFNV